MRRLASLILALTMLCPSLALAYDVLVVQSKHDQAYDKVLQGFRAAFRHTERVVVLSDYAETDVVRIVREERPGLVLAIGDSALTAAKKVRQTPVIAVMSLSVTNPSINQPNLTGIGMYIQPESYMAIFRKLKARRVGVLYNPARSGWYLRQARQPAKQAGVELVLREVRDPRETLAKLSGLAGQVDAIWMLPDTVAVTRETAEAYFNFSQKQRVPVVSFASAYLGLGAAAVLEIKRGDLGRQAGELAASLLKGHADTDEIDYPDKVVLKTNQGVLKNLGICPGEHDLCHIRSVDYACPRCNQNARKLNGFLPFESSVLALWPG